MNYIEVTYPQTVSVDMQGYMYDYLYKVFLSSANIDFPSLTAIDLFSTNHVVSAICPPFVGYELPLSAVNIVDKNNVSITLPSISAIGYVDIILFNNAGYTKLSDRDYLIAYPIGTLREGIAAYWKLDGNLNDSSGNSSVIEVIDSIPRYGSGVIGESLSSFAWDRQYAEFAASLLNVQGGNCTLSFWFKMQNGVQDDNIKYLIDQSLGGIGIVVFGNGRMGAGWTDQAGTRIPLPDEYPLYEPFGWNHCVLTLDTTYIYIYINGVLAVQYEYSFPIVSINGEESSTIKFGYDGDAWSGGIDEVCIWNNRSLTLVEIQSIYNNGKGRDLS